MVPEALCADPIPYWSEEPMKQFGCHFRGVGSMIYEIVQNLCSNAVKYNVEQGRVDVSVKQVDGHVVLTVKDTGIGIPAEYQSRVFELFYQKLHPKWVQLLCFTGILHKLHVDSMVFTGC